MCDIELLNDVAMTAAAPLLLTDEHRPAMLTRAEVIKPEVDSAF